MGYGGYIGTIFCLRTMLLNLTKLPPCTLKVSSPISSKPQVCLPAVRDRQSSVVALCPRGVEAKTGNCLDLYILNYPQLQGCSEHPKYGGKTG